MKKTSLPSTTPPSSLPSFYNQVYQLYCSLKGDYPISTVITHEQHVAMYELLSTIKEVHETPPPTRNHGNLITTVVALLGVAILMLVIFL